MYWIRCRFVGILILSLLLLVLPANGQVDADLTLEDVVGLPSLTGTAPSSPTWSPDGSLLAFLWNSEGMPFSDVWLVSAQGEDLRQLTRMREFRSSSRRRDGEGIAPWMEPVRKLQQQARERMSPGVSEVIWAPDGESLLFLYRGDIFRVQRDGSALTRLFDTHGGRRSLKFSPDGQNLSWLEEGNLWLWGLESGRLKQVTDVDGRSSAPLGGSRFAIPKIEYVGYHWSADDRYLVLLLEDRRKVPERLVPDYLSDETEAWPFPRDYPGENFVRREVWIYNLGEDTLQEIKLDLPTDRRIGRVQWSPVAPLLLIDRYSENAEHRWIHVYDAGAGSLRELWHDRDPDRTSQRQTTSAWRSDGKAVLLVSDTSGRFHLHSVPLDGQSPRQLTDGEWSLISTGFSPAPLAVASKTGMVFFTATRQSPYQRPVYRIPESGGKIEQVTRLQGTHLPFPSPGGDRLALLRSSDTSPLELYLKNLDDDSAEKRITNSPLPAFHRQEWVNPRYVTFRSHVDGALLHGRLLEPPNLDRSRKYPVILGPVYSNTVRNQWRGLYGTLQQYMVKTGQYLVFQVDIAGSLGYGRDFRNRVLRDYGGIDVEDLHSGVEYLKTLPYVDGDRIGIWGWSYGGLLSGMSLSRKPGVYRAGVAGAPATNMWHALTINVEAADRPDRHPEVFRKGSVIHFGEELADPLMIIHGMWDSEVLFKDSVVWAEKLMLMNKDFEFVVLPGATHNFRRNDYVARFVVNKIMRHFDRYLGSAQK